MERYKDWDDDSNIVAYEIGDDFIIIEFRNGRERFYKYSYISTGQMRIENMKSLAMKGDGLNSFISTERPPYESKW